MSYTIAYWLLAGLGAAAIYAAGEALLRDLLLKRHRPLARRLLSYAFTVYLVVLVRLAVVPGVNPGPAGVTVNLVPFRSIGHYFYMLFKLNMLHIFAGNILGNLLLLLPMGFFLPAILKGKFNGWKILALSAALAIGIELTQLMLALLHLDTGRVVDIDDVIMNALGGLMGYWLNKFCMRAAARIRSKLYNT